MEITAVQNSTGATVIGLRASNSAIEHITRLGFSTFLR